MGAWKSCDVCRISIHALLAESDRKAKANEDRYKHFYPRSPCGERPALGGTTTPEVYFYPRSPCGERQPSIQVQHLPKSISIHALLAESDNCEPVLHQSQKHFYPRSPCGERLNSTSHTNLPEKFLSTLSLRRATACHNGQLLGIYHFYPRSPCGERPPRGGSCYLDNIDFYPRSPCGERPGPERPGQNCQSISIHALLAESDQK